ncbi:putative quinone oxidoreductase [Clohesyomyces aquaticus]|uniref:Putative quinone oxidoreductase n=1 Tax=Clohesyomyces aquaticus TaxID=1231657 RepID=A0A1Y2A3A2_9PLEO|nr:putative quinone oxidoreductase [Clohesyomyces aquaticus]
MTPSNNAAFLTAKATPLKIQSAPYTPPGENEIVVKNAAVAINPYDYIVQEAPGLVVSWAKMPIVLGTDIAGQVVEIGKGVKRFKVGDRVVAYSAAMTKKANRSCEGGFQEYTVVRTNLASIIPQSMPYESAAVLPLGLGTAAGALFQKDLLALPLPTTSPTPTGKAVLVWGGSTSLGCNAIQLARAAGCEVITTASPKNHAYLKELGAAEVFDYKSPTVVKDIISAFKTRDCAGALAIGRGSSKACIDIIAGCKGNKCVVQATLDFPDFPKGALAFPGFLVGMVGAIGSVYIQTKLKGVTAKFVNGGDLIATEVGKAIYEDYLPAALEQNAFIPSPKPHVVGHGLEHLQEAMNMSKKGVSATKLVVTL